MFFFFLPFISVTWNSNLMTKFSLPFNHQKQLVQWRLRQLEKWKRTNHKALFILFTTRTSPWTILREVWFFSYIKIGVVYSAAIPPPPLRLFKKIPSLGLFSLLYDSKIGGSFSRGGGFKLLAEYTPLTKMLFASNFLWP